MMIDFYGEDITVKKMRKHLAWYIKTFPNSSKIKEKIFKLEDRDEVLNVLYEYML